MGTARSSLSRSAIVLVAMVAFHATRSLVAYACTCSYWTRTLGPEEMIAEYGLVFAGTVVSIEQPADERGGCRSEEDEDFSSRVTFVVDESFRGSEEGEEIVVPADMATSCGMSLERGERLVLAADRSDPWVGYCLPHLTLGVGATYIYCVPDKTKDSDPAFSEGCWGDDDPVMLTEEEFLDGLRAAAGD